MFHHLDVRVLQEDTVPEVTERGDLGWIRQSCVEVSSEADRDSGASCGHVAVVTDVRHCLLPYGSGVRDRAVYVEEVVIPHMPAERGLGVEPGSVVSVVAIDCLQLRA